MHCIFSTLNQSDFELHCEIAKDPYILFYVLTSKLGVKGTNLNCLVTKKNTLSHKKPFWPVNNILDFLKSSYLVLSWKSVLCRKRERFSLNLCCKMSTNFLRISFFIFESLKQPKRKEFESYKLYGQCQWTSPHCLEPHITM